MTAVLAPRLFEVHQHELTSDDYYTPAWVFERMGLTFDLDVCAPPGGIPWIPAARYFDMADDGLAQPWEGRVWMNPPYSDCTPWVRRFIDHGNGIALVQMSKSAWCETLVSVVDGFMFLPISFAFQGGPRPTWHDKQGTIFMPVFLAAFGAECVEAIGRLGRVRR